MGGSPRTFTKLSRGIDEGGPMRIGNGACVAGSAETVAAMLTIGRSACALAGMALTNPSAAFVNPAIAVKSRQNEVGRRWLLAVAGAASFTACLPITPNPIRARTSWQCFGAQSSSFRYALSCSLMCV